MSFRHALMFNLRSSPEIGVPHPDLYPACLDMAEYADGKGIDNIMFAEHHSDDGYIPSPALMATAVAARTKSCAISLNALVLPLHDPVDIAETILVGDLIAQGRLHTIFAAGYAQSEFSLFGRSLRERGKLMDEGLDVITRALSGERFKYGDRDVAIRPTPKTAPKLYVGGGVPAAAKRAAKFGLGFSPLGARMGELFELYDEECRKLGRAPGPRFYRSVGVHVAEDVDMGWQEAGPYILHEAKQYAAISADEKQSNSPLHGLTSIEAVRKSGVLRVVTPDECVELARTVPSISVMPLIGGMPPEIGWKSVKLFCEKALPRINALPLKD